MTTQDFRLFTSVRLEHGQCELLPIHLDHLAASAAALGFALDRSALQQGVQRLAEGAAAIPVAKLRITLEKDGSWTLGVPLPLFPDADHLQALLWPEPTDSRDPWLQHKTTERPVYDHVVRAVHACGFIDAIFHNTQGMVTEGGVHSVFARWGDTWKTPTLAAGVLPGTYRQHMLKTSPAIQEEDFTVDELLQADEVWLTNAVRGIRRVTVVQQ